MNGDEVDAFLEWLEHQEAEAAEDGIIGTGEYVDWVSETWSQCVAAVACGRRLDCDCASEPKGVSVE